MVRYGYSATTALHGSSSIQHTYPQCTLIATPTCSRDSSTVSYETYVAGQRNLNVWKQKEQDIIDKRC